MKLHSNLDSDIPSSISIHHEIGDKVYFVMNKRHMEEMGIDSAIIDHYIFDNSDSINKLESGIVKKVEVINIRSIDKDYKSKWHSPIYHVEYENNDINIMLTCRADSLYKDKLDFVTRTCGTNTLFELNLLAVSPTNIQPNDFVIAGNREIAYHAYKGAKYVNDLYQLKGRKDIRVIVDPSYKADNHAKSMVEELMMWPVEMNIQFHFVPERPFDLPL
jgi:hypothetical protein